MEGRLAVCYRGELWRLCIRLITQMLLNQEKIVRNLDRMAGLTTDVRILHRPFVRRSHAWMDVGH